MRNRLKGETVKDYVSKLQELAKSCHFENLLDIMLRDRLVCGINNVAIQCQLLMQPTLTLKQALDIAQEQGESLKDFCSVSIKNNTFAVIDVGKVPIGQPIIHSTPCNFFGHRFDFEFFSHQLFI